MASFGLAIVLLSFVAVSSAFVTVTRNVDYTADNEEITSLSKTVQRLLSPPAEGLRLLEGFLEVKGDVASRLYSLIDNNAGLIRSAYNVIVNSAPTLHSISLTGVQFLRATLEFLIQCISQWENGTPEISYQESSQIPNFE